MITGLNSDNQSNCTIGCQIYNDNPLINRDALTEHISITKSAYIDLDEWTDKFRVIIHCPLESELDTIYTKLMQSIKNPDMVFFIEIAENPETLKESNIEIFRGINPIMFALAPSHTNGTNDMLLLIFEKDCAEHVTETVNFEDIKNQYLSEQEDF